MNLIAVAFFCSAYVSHAMRVHKKQTNESEIQGSSFTGWQKGRTFACLQKWQKRAGGDIEKFCLVDLEQVMDALVNGGKSDKYAMTVPTRWGWCESNRRPYAMRVCNLKGKEDKRVSYSTRVLVPKACFTKYGEEEETFKPDGETSVATFEAAVTASECNQIIMDSRQGKVGKVGKLQSRGKFVPAPTPEPTPAPTEEPTLVPTEEPTDAPTEDSETTSTTAPTDDMETTATTTSTTSSTSTTSTSITTETTTEPPTTTTTTPEQDTELKGDLTEPSSLDKVDADEEIDRDEEIKPAFPAKKAWPPPKPVSVGVDKKKASARAFAKMDIWGGDNVKEAEWCKAFPLNDGCNALRWKVCPVTCKALYQGDKPICHTPIYNPWIQGKACIPVQRSQCPQRCLCIAIDPNQAKFRSCTHPLHKNLCPQQCS